MAILFPLYSRLRVCIKDRRRTLAAANANGGSCLLGYAVTMYIIVSTVQCRRPKAHTAMVRTDYILVNESHRALRHYMHGMSWREYEEKEELWLKQDTSDKIRNRGGAPAGAGLGTFFVRLLHTPPQFRFIVGNQIHPRAGTANHHEHGENPLFSSLGPPTRCLHIKAYEKTIKQRTTSRLTTQDGRLS